MEKIVIVGLGSAGYSTLITLAKMKKKYEITVIDPKPFDLLHPCGIPYAINNEINSDDLSQNIGLDRMKINRIKAIVNEITDKKTVKYTKDKEEFEIDFDFLVISTGFTSSFPPIENLKSKIGLNLYTLKNLDDLSEIKEKLMKSDLVAVIGAGAIGLEAAVSMKKMGKAVSIYEMSNQVLNGILDLDISKIVEEYLKENEIQFISGEAVKKILGVDKFEGVILDKGDFSADLGIFAAGFKANVELAKKSNLKYSNNGIVVSENFETSMKDVFAAGDCISSWSRVDGKEIPAKLATSAYKHGELVAKAIAGDEVKYLGTAATFVTKVGDLEVAGTGLNLENAKSRGFNPVVGKIKGDIFPEYSSNSIEITIKVIIDKESKKFLGAQAISEKGAAERINIISTAIEFDIKATEIGRVEMAYCPVVSEVYDPLLRAIDFGLRRIK